jgi:hypothetical protein
MIEAALLAAHDLHAAVADSGSSLELVAWIVVPVAIFIVGVVTAAIRGAIRFAQYMTRSENSQSSVAQTNKEISDRLSGFVDHTEKRFDGIDRHLGIHDQQIAVLDFQNGNGHPPKSKVTRSQPEQA